MILTIFNNLDIFKNIAIFYDFRQFWQLRTWIHDNLCYLTIKSDTGQHSQFLRCLFLQFQNTWQNTCDQIENVPIKSELVLQSAPLMSRSPFEMFWRAKNKKQMQETNKRCSQSFKKKGMIVATCIGIKAALKINQIMCESCNAPAQKNQRNNCHITERTHSSHFSFAWSDHPF